MAAYRCTTDDAESIASRIRVFSPRSVDNAVWDQIGPWVRATVTASGPQLHSQAAGSLKALTQLAGWAVGEGLDLDTNQVLSPAVLERYRLTGMRQITATSRAAEMSRLRRVAKTVTTTAPWPPEGESAPRGALSPPYTATEIERFWDAAGRQRGVFRRHAMTAVLALTLGVGARSGELFTVRADDVVDIAGITAVRLSSTPERTVAVRNACVEPLLRVRAAAGDGPLVGSRRSGRDQASALLGTFEYSRVLPQLVVPRLRSTWLASVLADCNVVELFTAAGIASGKALSDLVPHLPQSQVGSPGWARIGGRDGAHE